METALIIVAALACAVCAAGGFLVCAMLTAGKVDDLEEALCHFARGSNWKLGVVDGGVAHVWVGNDDPARLAKEALR